MTRQTFAVGSPAVGGPALQLAGRQTSHAETFPAAGGGASDTAARNVTGKRGSVVQKDGINVHVAVVMAAALAFLIAVRKGFRPLLNR